MAAAWEPSSTGSASAKPQTAEAQKFTTGSFSKDTDPPIAPSVMSAQIVKYSCIFVIPYLYLICFHYNIDARLKQPILINAVFSAAGFLATLRLIPVFARKLLNRNIYGYDINKKGTPRGSVKVPESLGIVVGVVFLVVIILFASLNLASGSKWLEDALIPIGFMLGLGFADDVLDVPWRVKLLLPSIATLPLLRAYTDPTIIIIPTPLHRCFGGQLELGSIYKLYMWLFTIFCTNSINIHAGINGLEVGQTVVVACSILIHNVMQIGVGPGSDSSRQGHALSIYFVQPLLATSLALLSFNWYPSSAFVGDAYTYFAGMTLAVSGILGHFSETLTIFFLPQILNFLLSLPQLSGYIPCPRHRLPRFDPQTGLLSGTDDGTLVNFFLRQFGKMSERTLCVILLAFQAICCCFCFWLRWYLTGWYK